MVDYLANGFEIRFAAAGTIFILVILSTRNHFGLIIRLATLANKWKQGTIPLLLLQYTRQLHAFVMNPSLIANAATNCWLNTFTNSIFLIPKTSSTQLTPTFIGSVILDHLFERQQGCDVSTFNKVDSTYVIFWLVSISFSPLTLWQSIAFSFCPMSTSMLFVAILMKMSSTYGVNNGNSLVVKIIRAIRASPGAWLIQKEIIEI